MNRDPFLHLEWDNIDFDEFIQHVTQLILDTNWHENTVYPEGITLTEARNMRIMGFDAGLWPAVLLAPKTTNIQDWRLYYLFIRICHSGDFTLDI